MEWLCRGGPSPQPGRNLDGRVQFGTRRIPSEPTLMKARRSPRRPFRRVAAGGLCSTGLDRLRAGVAGDHSRFTILLRVPLRAQETEGWCWAASVEMILGFLGTELSQRDLANKHFSTPAGGADAPGTWRGGAWPQFDKYGFDCKTTMTAFSWEAVTNELGAGRPFAFCRKWEDGPAYHILVVSGCYLTLTGRRYLQIHNPSPTRVGKIQRVPYGQYVRGKAAGRNFVHERTYYEIRKKLQPNVCGRASRRKQARRHA